MLWALLGLGWIGAPRAAIAPEVRLQAVERDIARLREELARLGARAAGLLGELERVQAALRLKEAEHRAAALRLEGAQRSVERIAQSQRELQQAQARRQRYLAFRLREIYKLGPAPQIQRLAAWGEPRDYARALQDAAYLSGRDARVLEAYRREARELEATRQALERERAAAARAAASAVRARGALARAQAEYVAAVSRLEADQEKRRQALEELRQAQAALERLARTGQGVAPALDIRRFRGLLDWPAEGTVRASFGNRVHPRFRTAVPHPGLDIEAPEGSDFRAVFDGTVLYAAWLHGYGLTVLVDHGHGIVSVYAHASVLVVEQGEPVVRGQVLGSVGDTGSLEGPYLYFELREAGRPVDPLHWLRAPSRSARPVANPRGQV